MNRGFYFLLLVGIALSSCERTVDTPFDPDYSQPYLSTLEISPVSFNTDTILVNGQTSPDDILALSLTCSVNATAPEPGAGVTFTITGPEAGRVYATGTLRDDGVFPDVTAGDGKYTGTVTFSIRRVDVGYFEISVQGSVSGLVSSNIVRRNIPIFRTSRAPSVHDLVAPDSVTLPPANQVLLILMSVAVSDSDGLGDIREVFFRNLDSPSDTNRRFVMYDDGDVDGLSGDSVANDGRYSITVQLPAGTPAATYRFAFSAEDRLKLVGPSLVHPLTVLGPE